VGGFLPVINLHVKRMELYRELVRLCTPHSRECKPLYTVAITVLRKGHLSQFHNKEVLASKDKAQPWISLLWPKSIMRTRVPKDEPAEEHSGADDGYLEAYAPCPIRQIATIALAPPMRLC